MEKGKKNIKICFIIDGFGCGGKERQFLELIKVIKDKINDDSYLVAMSLDGHYRDKFEATGIEIKYLIRRKKWDIRIFKKLFLLFKNNKPDIVHSISLMTSFYSVFVCRIFKIKFINGAIRDCLPARGIYKLIEPIVLKFSDINLSNSEAGLKFRGLKINEKNKVIHNGFDFSRLKKEPIIAELKDIGQEYSIVGMVASFSELKDYNTFFNAAIKLLNKKLKIKFITVGEGKNLNYYKNYVQRYNNNFVFLGNRNDVEGIINSFDIGVLTTFSEGLSNSIIEYMAIGKPVIATDCEGNRELVLDKITGFLSEPENPDDLAGKIEFLLKNKSIAREFGMKGKERIKNEFDVRTLFDKTYELYNIIT